MCSVAWSLSDCPCCPTSQVQIKKAWSLRISGREVAAPLWVQVFSIKTNLLLCHGEKEASVKRETRRVGSPFLPVATVVCGFKEARSVSEEGSLSVCLPQLCPSLLPSLPLSKRRPMGALANTSQVCNRVEGNQDLEFKATVGPIARTRFEREGW